MRHDDRLLHGPGVVTVGLSAGYETWLMGMSIVWYKTSHLIDISVLSASFNTDSDDFNWLDPK